MRDFAQGLIAAVVAVLVLGLSGCSWLDSACSKVMPDLVVTQGKLADLQRAISEVERYQVCERLPPAQAATCGRALADLRGAYRVAVQATALAGEACSTTDIRGVLEIVVKAWSAIRPFLGLIGGTGTPDVVDPVIWTEAQ